ncbi:hypothetical protein [Sabulicella rubraurantiaca]|uniref:hypothetical protein n=1 Tax=Sabulicella rubraurantiaca TaxID=2811429 RepID=UPI002E2BF182|nr:hypothetical protein [Sabulicella rubraurantiaca]
MTIKGSDILGSGGEIEVRIMDLSGGNGAEPVEVVRGFSSLAHANQFARRRVRDSVEFCRAPGMDAAAVRDAWFAFGEDAVVEGGGEGGWTSASELADFAAHPCRDAEQRNWRVLDPRRIGEEEDEDGGEDGEGDGDGDGGSGE